MSWWGARRVLAAVALVVTTLPVPPAPAMIPPVPPAPAMIPPVPPAPAMIPPVPPAPAMIPPVPPAPAPGPSPSPPEPWPQRPCPSNPLCVCSDDHLVCNNVPLHRFPETGDGVRHVSVWRAPLVVLAAAALDGRRLRTLVLAACRLHALRPAALASMEPTLASLDLGFNEFTEVPIDSLRGLKVLNWLNLQNNYIGDLDENVEWGHLSETLTSLTLSNNRVGAVHAGALAGLRRLARLDLDGNGLRALAATALPPALAQLRTAHNLLRRPYCARLPRLRHLQLRDNLLGRPPFPPAPPCGDRSAVDSVDLSQNDLDDSFDFGFLGAFRLRRLVLDLNDLTKIPSLPPEAVRLEKLSMSHNMLTEVSDAAVRALKRDLEHLDLDHNELAALPGSVRELVRLRHLSVSYNRLERLEELPPRLSSLAAAGNYLTAFPAGLRRLAPASLRRLDLGYNRLAEVPRDTFGPWAASLTWLDLRGNLIAHLAADAFPPSLPLRELALSFNDLYLVDRHAFDNLTDLRVLGLSSVAFNGGFPLEIVSPDLIWLSLDNNNIHRIYSDDFYALPSVEHLNLDFNKLVVFPSDTDINISHFSSKLKELKLSYNYIGAVNPMFIAKLTELESLDLSYNRLRNVSERCFTSLGNLVYLSLAGNLLEFMAEKAFEDLRKLEVLDLQENDLTELSLGSFENLASEDVLLTLNVSYNRISSLVGGSDVFITILDLSHNFIENLPRTFFDSLGRTVRQILLANNRLVSIDSFSSGTLPNLHILNLSNNSIGSVRRRAFGEVPALQALDLSHNRLAQLAAEQFGGARRLRQLRLAANQLRALPRDCFRHTLLEHLDLADNRLAANPAPALAHVGFTLRRLDLAGNRLERLGAAAFRETAFLRELDLSRNALTALPDDALAGLPRLTGLSLSRNAVDADLGRLVRGAPALRSLAVADAGLRAVPRLPLANLTRLDLAGNRIAAFRESDVRALARLRRLDVSRNGITALRPTMWAALPQLTHLDVSRNPIVRVGDGAFEGLARLVELRMDGLRRLEELEPRSFRALASLRALRLELGAGGALARLAAEVPSLEALTLTLRARALDAQLEGVRAPKLRALELRGETVRAVSAGALSSLGRRPALTLVLRGVGARALPPGFLRPLARVPLLALDLADSRLDGFEPAALYPNLTDWNRLATKLLAGGLVVSGERLRCGCAVWWVGAWLRRWAAEVGGGTREARAAAARSWCAGAAVGAGAGAGAGAAVVPRTRLLVAGAEQARCQARALSGRASRVSRSAPAFLWMVLLHSLS